MVGAERGEIVRDLRGISKAGGNAGAGMVADATFGRGEVRERVMGEGAGNGHPSGDEVSIKPGSNGRLVGNRTGDIPFAEVGGILARVNPVDTGKL